MGAFHPVEAGHGPFKLDGEPRTVVLHDGELLFELGVREVFLELDGDRALELLQRAAHRIDQLEGLLGPALGQRDARLFQRVARMVDLPTDAGSPQASAGAGQAGPASLESAVMKGMRKAGVPAAHIHHERFGV